MEFWPAFVPKCLSQSNFLFNYSVSLIAFTTIAFLTVMEFMVYRDTWMKYEYEVDKDFTR